MREFLTVCPRNCYSTCSFRVFTEGGRIKRILPSEKNLATPEGPCIKGLSYLEREISPSRIIYPLKRNASGTFNRVSYKDAIDIISSRLLEARSQFGPHSVLFYKGSGSSGLSNDISSIFWNLFGGATTTYGNLCWPAGLEAVRLTLGEVKHNVPWDLSEARLIIIWGKNPAETNVQEMIHIDRALKKGAKVVVIDPRRTLTADKADLLIRPVPGSDAALALAIAKTIIDNDLCDFDFIRKHVKGFEQFAASLKTDPAAAEKITGVPAATVKELAFMIGKAETMTLIPGFGLQRYTNGGQTIRSLLSLPAITGNLGRKGCGFNFANLQGYIYDDIKEPLSYYPDVERDRPFRRQISMARFAHDFSKLSEPPVHVAWIERGNPITQLPESLKTREAFEAIPFKVVVDQFMTDTASLADIVLPARGTFEQPDIVSSYWHPYVQYKPAIIDPPGEVIPESEIYYRLAMEMKLCNANSSPLPAPGNSNFDEWLEKRTEPGGITLEELRNGPVIPEGTELIAYSDLKFETPSGKIELYSEDAERLWRISPLPDYVPLDKQPDADSSLRLISPNIASRIHSQFGNLEIIKAVVECPFWEISFFDARRMDLKTGDRIRIFNSDGEVKGTVHVSNQIKRGTIVFPNGIWLSEGGGVNSLISGKETDIGHGAAFHNTRVTIEKINS